MADYSTSTWHNEPPERSTSNGTLSLVTGKDTDFWQRTFYGFQRDDGHFLGQSVEGDFTAIVEFEGVYETLYDQAGLMLRVGPNDWIKAGIEYSDGVTNFSTVVTRGGQSDWSVIGVPHVTGPQKVRMTRKGGAVLTHFLAEDGGWRLMRVAPFETTEPARIGPMACSPQRTGFQATFLSFDVGPAMAKPLHGD